jgi:hypothetical protein
MNRQQQVAPEFTIDADGQELAHVALTGSTQRATMYAEDYRRIAGAGWSTHWSLVRTAGKNEYVLANVRAVAGHRRTITVARLVMAAQRGERVSHIDGDKLNLRRNNLSLRKGGGTSRFAVASLKPSVAALRGVGTEPQPSILASKRQHMPSGTARNPQTSLSPQRATGSTQGARGAPPMPVRVHAGTEEARL